jgi:predicted dehydrogenase
MSISVALIGCGEQARTNILPSLLATSGACLRVVCDPNEEQARATAACLPGVRVRKDYRALFDDSERIDAVIIVASPQIHYEAATLALEHGVHVFTEKPPTVTTAELESLAELARSKGLVTAVGHNLRYATACDVLFQLIKDRAPEKLRGFDVRYVVSGPRGDRWALNSPLRSFLLSHGVHVLDLVLHFLGQPGSISASAVPAGDGGILVSVRLGFASGALSNIVAANCGALFQLDIWSMFESGLHVHLDSLSELRCYGESSRGARWSECWRPKTLEAGYSRPGYLGEVREFFEAIRVGRATSPSFEEEVATYRVLDAIESQIESSTC